VSRSYPSAHELASTIAVGAVACLAPALARLELGRLQRWLEPHRPSAPLRGREASLIIETIERRVDRVQRRGKPLIRSGCLPRGITLYYFLRRAGLDVDLCFGIGSPLQQPVVGHCWLVLGDIPILERRDPLPLYTEVVRLSRRGLTHPPEVAGQDQRSSDESR
jgi:Transglutaminase-like superfamily